MKVLILAEHNGHTLNAVTRSAIAAGLVLTPTVDVVVFEAASSSLPHQIATCAGVATVLSCVAPQFSTPHSPEAVVAPLASLASAYDAIFAPATTFGKNILPRLAAHLDMGQFSDVIEILGPKKIKRPIYAGNAIAHMETADSILIATIRPTAFAAVGDGASPAPISLVSAPPQGEVTTCFEGMEVTVSERPDLVSAKIVVAGGRALGCAENFKLIEGLADRLGGGVGASRAAVDAGYAPNDCQVGQTGKIVAPDLYIAVGISGAIQHVAGMKESKIIVAINKDPDAPICQIADYTLIADLFQAVPEMITTLK